jgi:hypothetical protein
MTEKEIKEIYDRLLSLTKNHAIRWKKTEDSEYLVNFSRSSVAIERYYYPEYVLTVLKVFNEDGILVAYAASQELLDEEEGAKQFVFDPSELFNLVQDEVYKYSQTSENILNELRELGLQKGG